MEEKYDIACDILFKNNLRDVENYLKVCSDKDSDTNEFMIGTKNFMRGFLTGKLLDIMAKNNIIHPSQYHLIKSEFLDNIIINRYKKYIRKKKIENI